MLARRVPEWHTHQTPCHGLSGVVLSFSGLCRCLGLPAALLIFVTQAFFLASMDPMTPLLAAALAGIVNLGGDVLLVCFMNKGIAGAAFATAVAQASLARHPSYQLALLCKRRP